MSFDIALKRLKVLSLAACMCVCAAFLSSCGNSDSSKQPVQTTATANDSAVLTVTTAADKVETEELEGADNAGESLQTDNLVTSTVKSSGDKTVAQSGGESSGQSKNPGGDSSSSSGTVSGSSGSKTTTASSNITTLQQTQPQTPSGDDIDSRQYLLDLVKDQKLRTAARSVMINMQTGKTEIHINDGVLKESQLSDFMGFISMLEAESYIIPSPYSYTVNKSGYVTSLKITKYPKSVSQYQKEKTAVNEIVSELVSQAEKNCSTQFDKVLFFHDYIINNCVYDLDAVNGASAYGCLVEGRAVCEGYAKAMQLLCSSAGIESIPVTGHASYRGNSQSHMWNLINIDGCWTHVDATWDDIESNAISACCYSYFGLTDTEIRIDHSVSENPLISIPKASSNSSSYYVRRGYYISSEERIEAILEKAVNDAVKNSSETVTVRCESEALYELTNEIAASGSYEYEYMIELIKSVKNRYGISASDNDGFLIGDCPNAKDTYTIVYFLKY